MPKTNVFTILLAGASLLIAGQYAAAGPANQGKGQGKGGDRQGQERQAKHMHKHMSGKNALGDKLKRNGKHEVGKIKDKTVTADVENGKVRNMAAGDLPMKRMKTTMKMAGVEGGLIPVAYANGVVPAQFTVVEYYGYCFDDGYDLVCYWYQPDEVYYTDYYWEDYDPYY